MLLVGNLFSSSVEDTINKYHSTIKSNADFFYEAKSKYRLEIRANRADIDYGDNHSDTKNILFVYTADAFDTGSRGFFLTEDAFYYQSRYGANKVKGKILFKNIDAFSIKSGKLFVTDIFSKRIDINVAFYGKVEKNIVSMLNEIAGNKSVSASNNPGAYNNNNPSNFHGLDDCASGVDVCLSLEGNNLNYASNVDIAGFQFNHNRCIASVSGGDAEKLGGFTLSASSASVIGFSLTGGTIPAGSGTLLILNRNVRPDCLDDFIFSNSSAQALSVGFYTESTAGWSNADRQQFIADCVAENIGDENLCSCLLSDMELEFSNYEVFNNSNNQNAKDILLTSFLECQKNIGPGLPTMPSPNPGSGRSVPNSNKKAKTYTYTLKDNRSSGTFEVDSDELISVRFAMKDGSSVLGIATKYVKRSGVIAIDVVDENGDFTGETKKFLADDVRFIYFNYKDDNKKIAQFVDVSRK